MKLLVTILCCFGAMSVMAQKDKATIEKVILGTWKPDSMYVDGMKQDLPRSALTSTMNFKADKTIESVEGNNPVENGTWSYDEKAETINIIFSVQEEENIGMKVISAQPEKLVVLFINPAIQNEMKIFLSPPKK